MEKDFSPFTSPWYEALKQPAPNPAQVLEALKNRITKLTPSPYYTGGAKFKISVLKEIEKMQQEITK